MVATVVGTAVEVGGAEAVGLAVGGSGTRNLTVCRVSSSVTKRAMHGTATPTCARSNPLLHEEAYRSSFRRTVSAASMGRSARLPELKLWHRAAGNPAFNALTCELSHIEPRILEGLAVIIPA